MLDSCQAIVGVPLYQDKVEWFVVVVAILRPTGT